jgi:hypothetical protein
MRTQLSIGGLFSELKYEGKNFLRDEFQLAKTELIEKLSRLSKNGTLIAVGGFAAYAGLVIFLCALGLLAAYFIERAGLDPVLAIFIGLGITGLVVMVTGCGVLFGGWKALKRQSLRPERTLETLQHFKAPPEASAYPTKKSPAEHRSPDELEAAVMHTEGQMADTIRELTDKVLLKEFRENADREFHTHPYRWGLIAGGLGVAGGYLFERNLSQHRRDT